MPRLNNALLILMITELFSIGTRFRFHLKLMKCKRPSTVKYSTSELINLVNELSLTMLNDLEN